MFNITGIGFFLIIVGFTKLLGPEVSLLPDQPVVVMGIHKCETDTSLTITICEGLSYMLNGVEYDSAGIFNKF